LLEGVLYKYFKSEYVQQSDASILQLPIEIFFAVTAEVHVSNNIQKYLVIESSGLYEGI
jgi:hypothetical protein